MVAGRHFELRFWALSGYFFACYNPELDSSYKKYPIYKKYQNTYENYHPSLKNHIFLIWNHSIERISTEA